MTPTEIAILVASALVMLLPAGYILYKIDFSKASFGSYKGMAVSWILFGVAVAYWVASGTPGQPFWVVLFLAGLATVAGKGLQEYMGWSTESAEST
jgi:hypothetical protein